MVSVVTDKDARDWNLWM